MLADNPFDQFDQPDAPQPAAAPLAQAPTSAPAAPPQTPAQAANPFDQFDDAHAAPAAAPPPPDYSAVNEMMRHMYRNGKSVQEIVDFGTHHGVTPNADQITDARSKGFGDVNFAHPEQATIHSQPGIVHQFMDNTANDWAGILQGAAALPDAAATATGKIVSAVPTLVGSGLDALGLHNAANEAHSIAHGLANPLQIGSGIEHLYPTPDTTSGKLNRFVGQLFGGVVGMPTSALENVTARLVGEVPKGFIPATSPAPASPQAPDYVQLARDLKVRRTPATNSSSGIAPVVQAGLGALPGGAPIGAAAEREAGGLANAAKGIAESVGTISDRQGAGEAVAQGAQTYAQTSKAEGSALYGKRDSAMGGTEAPVSLDNFGKSVNDLAQQFPDSPALQQLREHPVIRQVTGALGQAANSEDGQVTLGQATEALSHVRGVFRNLKATSSASPVVISRVAGVEQALEDDVMNGARAADQAMGREPGAPGSAVKAQQDADKFWADRAGALNSSLKKPLQSASDDTRVSGEQVYNQVSGDMDAKSGNVARLRDTWFRLPQEAKSTFAATKIDDLGRATPGQQNADGSAWSFQSFLTNFNKMSPQARNIVFGGNVDNQLQQIATYANRLRQLDKMRNFSNTAQKYFAGAFMATVGGAVIHGDLGGAAEAAMAIPATWGGAKLLLSTPAMRDWTVSALKAATTGNESAARVLTAKLGAIAPTQPAFSNEIQGLQQAIQKVANDAVWPAAASGNQKKPQANGSNASAARQ